VYSILLALVLLQMTLCQQLCYETSGNAFYDLTPLQSNIDYLTNVTDDLFISYNFCRFSNQQCGMKYSFANMFSRNLSNDCIRLTNTTKYTSIFFSLLDPSNPSGGIQYNYTGGDFTNVSITYNDGSTFNPNNQTVTPPLQYSFVLNLLCDLSAVNYTQTIQYFDFNNSAYVINATTASACPVMSISQIGQFITDNWVPFTVVGSIAGLAETFLGYKLFVATLFFAGFLGAFFTSLAILFTMVVSADSGESVKYVILIFSLVMGVAVGYITARTVKFGFFLLGAWLGTIISLLLFNAFLYKIEANPPELVLYICIGVLGGGFGVLAIVFFNQVSIIATSFCGAYITIRSISIPLGGFPNEFDLAEQIQNSNYTITVTWQFYVYMNAMIVLSLIGMYAQWKIKKHSDSKLEQEDNYFKQPDEAV